MSVYGFTPINSNTEPVSSNVCDEKPAIDCSLNNEQSTLVSKCLGRGQVEPPAHLAVVLKKPRPRKRKSTVTAQKTPKRRKRRNDTRDEDPLLTPPQTKEKRTPDLRAMSAAGTEAQVSDRTVDHDLDTVHEHEGQGGQARSKSSQPTYNPLSTPTTSMTMDQTQHTTSVNVVKAAATPGVTFYNEAIRNVSHAPHSAGHGYALSGSFTYKHCWSHDPFRPNSDRQGMDDENNRLLDDVEDDADVYAAEAIMQDDHNAVDDELLESVSSPEPNRPFQSDDCGILSPIDHEDNTICNGYEDYAVLQEEKPRRPMRQNTREVSPSCDYDGAFMSPRDRQILRDLKSQTNEVKPVVRKEFPKPIMERSPVVGVSNASYLRTCFRIGEAINAASEARRTNKDALIELYARAQSSCRQQPPSVAQTFILADLYHDRPPYLHGTFRLWNQSRLWDVDGRRFLQAKLEPRMCRAVGKLKLEASGWCFEIFNIWEADTEDVDYVAGIFSKDA